MHWGVDTPPWTVTNKRGFVKTTAAIDNLPVVGRKTNITINNKFDPLQAEDADFKPECPAGDADFKPECPAGDVGLDGFPSDE